MKDHPPAVGAQVTNEEVEALASTLYRRFYHEYGRLDWRDARMERFRIKFRRQVREVVDSLEINGLIITRQLPSSAEQLFKKVKK